MSDFLGPHGLQHTSLPCPSPTPGACSNSCPSSRWSHPIISSSVIPFSFHLQSFQALGSFLVSQWLKSWTFSFNISPSNEFPLGPISFRIDWFELLEVQRILRVFSKTTVQKHQFFGPQLYSPLEARLYTNMIKPYPVSKSLEISKEGGKNTWKNDTSHYQSQK